MSKKNTKRALLSSVLALVLCFAMLTGTTFAWFTDSVTSGKNQIVAGNLDVELAHTNSYVANEDVEGNTDLFCDKDGKPIKWEPGVMAWEKFTVKNVGNLALKYQLSINFTNEKKVNGHGLSEVLKVAVLNVEPTRENIESATLMDMADFLLSENNALAAGGEESFYVAIYWKPTDHDNDYNMNNGNQGKTLSIDLGISLKATQQTAENDSFDNQYDAGAYLPIVYKAEELASALANGESVKLGADMTAAEVIDIPAGATVVVDLNGKTLKAADGSVAIRAYGDLILAGEGTIEGNADAYVVRAQAGSTVTVDEGIVIEGGFGAIAVPGGTLIVNGGDFSNVEVNASHYVVSVWNNGKVIINDGTFTFAEDRYAGPNGAPVIGTWGGGSVEIRGGTFDAFSGSALCYSGAQVVVKGGTFKNAATNTYGGTVNGLVADGYVATTNADGSVTVSLPQSNLDNMISNAQDGDEIVLPAGNYTIDNATNTNLTISGTKDTVIAVENESSQEGCDYGFRGSHVVFEGVTITTTGETYNGYAGMTAVYNNCVINNTYTLYGDSEFNNCTFNVSGDSYCIWTWGATNVTFNNCTFNTSGKAILLYGGANTNLTVNGCIFNDDDAFADVNNKAAIEVGDGYGTNFTLTVNDTVVNGFDITTKGLSTGTTLWGNKNSMPTSRLNVVIDGVDVY